MIIFKNLQSLSLFIVVLILISCTDTKNDVGKQKKPEKKILNKQAIEQGIAESKNVQTLREIMNAHDVKKRKNIQKLNEPLMVVQAENDTNVYPTDVEPLYSIEEIRNKNIQTLSEHISAKGRKKNKNAQTLSKRMSALRKGERVIIRLAQFGDSHSASDFFTGHVRKRLQRKYGDAGIGWIPPMNIRGQRHARVGYETSQWILSDSRNDKLSSYPMGGYIATAEHPNAKLSIIPRNNDDNYADWRVTLLAKNRTNGISLSLGDSDAKQSYFTAQSSPAWQAQSFDMGFPTTITSDIANTQIGGLWLEKRNGKGIIVETVAANGAQLTMWNRWNNEEFQRDLTQLSRPDIITVAFGTNEAFNANLSIGEFHQSLHKKVKWLKHILPDAEIIILGAPEAYRQSHHEGNAMTCARPSLLDDIQQAQNDIAKQENVHFWNWQHAMGGRCQVEKLIEAGLMQKDRIHFTGKGYRIGAERFIDFLEEKILK